jgi:hypothetical protein
MFEPHRKTGPVSSAFLISHWPFLIHRLNKFKTSGVPFSSLVYSSLVYHNVGYAHNPVKKMSR